MSLRSQRGRVVQTRQKSNQMKIIYIILGVVVIAGIALLGFQFLPKSSTAVSTNTSLDSFPSKGNANAPVTVVEYGDFQCPSCGAFANYVEPSIDQQYIQPGKVRFVFHDFPLTQHLNAVPAAEAARCAADQGKFWEMHKLLFANQAQWSEISRPLPMFDAYAREIGLDMSTFDQCFNSEKYKPAILAAQQDAINAQIDATPTFVIDGQKYTAQNLKDGIEAALAKAGQK
ncbi:MAG TPA: thioredoxin domain-containing protein [Roseiflexaceae bacterium]|jgi:protein-disulfide isomerase|nr:thioredoxin domain-containing protein [Roseiflexaceae bacterium]